MAREVSSDDIKKVMFDMDNNKALRPNGFGALLFKRAWSIVEDDVIEAIQDFFASSCVLK